MMIMMTVMLIMVVETGMVGITACADGGYDCISNAAKAYDVDVYEKFKDRNISEHNQWWIHKIPLGGGVFGVWE